MKYFACIKNPRHVKSTARAIIKLGGNDVAIKFNGVRISFEVDASNILQIQNLYNIKALYSY